MVEWIDDTEKYCIEDWEADDYSEEVDDEM